jgi:hypothetical protein
VLGVDRADTGRYRGCELGPAGESYMEWRLGRVLWILVVASGGQDGGSQVEEEPTAALSATTTTPRGAVLSAAHQTEDPQDTS